MQIANSIILCLILITLSSCLLNRKNGTIPVFLDEYVSTTEERRFELEEIIEGYIIKYQKSYDCNHKFYQYNATAIISYKSNFITVYDYCGQAEFTKRR